MTITTPASVSDRTDAAASESNDPDVVLLGIWPNENVETPRYGSNLEHIETPVAGRPARSWSGNLSRRVRSWRPSAVLAMLLVTATLVMLVDLRDGPTQILRSIGQATGGTAQEWADRVIGPVRETPLKRPDGPALLGLIADLEARNSLLEHENAALAGQLRAAGEAGQVKKWAKDARLDVIPARIVAVESGRAANRSVTIDVGSRDGLEQDLAVVGQGALVGRLVDVGPSTSTVQLISDRGSHVWSRIVQSEETVVAAGSGDGIELEFVDSLAEIAQGQRLVTLGSPGSKPYPAGIPIARVVSVSSNPGQGGPQVTAEPIANLSALTVVGVVSPKSNRGGR